MQTYLLSLKAPSQSMFHVGSICRIESIHEMNIQISRRASLVAVCTFFQYKDGLSCGTFSYQAF